MYMHTYNNKKILGDPDMKLSINDRKCLLVHKSLPIEGRKGNLSDKFVCSSCDFAAEPRRHC